MDSGTSSLPSPSSDSASCSIEEDIRRFLLDPTQVSGLNLLRVHELQVLLHQRIKTRKNNRQTQFRYVERHRSRAEAASRACLSQDYVSPKQQQDELQLHLLKLIERTQSLDGVDLTQLQGLPQVEEQYHKRLERKRTERQKRQREAGRREKQLCENIGDLQRKIQDLNLHNKSVRTQLQSLHQQRFSRYYEVLQHYLQVFTFANTAIDMDTLMTGITRVFAPQHRGYSDFLPPVQGKIAKHSDCVYMRKFFTNVCSNIQQKVISVECLPDANALLFVQQNSVIFDRHFLKTVFPQTLKDEFLMQKCLGKELVFHRHYVFQFNDDHLVCLVRGECNIAMALQNVLHDKTIVLQMLQNELSQNTFRLSFEERGNEILPRRSQQKPQGSPEILPEKQASSTPKTCEESREPIRP